MESFIVAGARTPIGRYGGALAKSRPDDLAALAIGEAVSRADADLVVADGVESMTRAPTFSADTTLSMPQTAERVAQQWALTREELDAFALRSHERALDAIKNGRFSAEIIPVGDFVADEGPRPDTSLERLAALRPVNGPGGLVTAGNSSALNDGAAAVVVASERYVAEHGLTPRARIVAASSAGVPPEIMGIGPVPATRKVLARTGWSVDELDAIELNEAFASQSLACIRDLDLNEEVVNADGGAIALGHPLGCSGTRLLVTLLGRLERTGGRRGLATMCVGVDQGTAMLLERE